MFGTGVLYGATRCPVRTCCIVPQNVRYERAVWCYEMSSTDLVYGAVRCPVRTWCRVLRGVQCWHRVWCYAICSTDIGYGATRPQRAGRRYWRRPQGKKTL
eukprot:1769994-Rhodomonas_salina.1